MFCFFKFLGQFFFIENFSRFFLLFFEMKYLFIYRPKIIVKQTMKKKFFSQVDLITEGCLTLLGLLHCFFFNLKFNNFFCCQTTWRQNIYLIFIHSFNYHLSYQRSINVLTSFVGLNFCWLDFFVCFTLKQSKAQTKKNLTQIEMMWMMMVVNGHWWTVLLLFESIIGYMMSVCV